MDLLPAEVLAHTASFLETYEDKANFSMVATFALAASRACGDWWTAPFETWLDLTPGTEQRMASFLAWMVARPNARVRTINMLQMNLASATPDQMVHFGALAPSRFPEVTFLELTGYDSRFCRVDGFAHVTRLILSAAPQLDTSDVLRLTSDTLPPRLERLCVVSSPSVQRLCELELPPTVSQLTLSGVRLTGGSVAALKRVVALKALRMCDSEVQDDGGDAVGEAWRQLGVEELDMSTAAGEMAVVRRWGYPRSVRHLSIGLHGFGGLYFSFCKATIDLLPHLRAFQFHHGAFGTVLRHHVKLADGVFELDGVAYPNMRVTFNDLFM